MSIRINLTPSMRLFYSDLLSILVKNHGHQLASEFVKEPKVADQRLYQSIIIQAFEDCLYTWVVNEAYYKKCTRMVHK